MTVFTGMLYVVKYMIQTLWYRFCHSDFVCLSVIRYPVYDVDTVLKISKLLCYVIQCMMPTLCYRICQSCYTNVVNLPTSN